MERPPVGLTESYTLDTLANISIYEAEIVVKTVYPTASIPNEFSKRSIGLQGCECSACCTKPNW